LGAGIGYWEYTASPYRRLSLSRKKKGSLELMYAVAPSRMHPTPAMLIARGTASGISQIFLVLGAALAAARVSRHLQVVPVLLVKQRADGGWCESDCVNLPPKREAFSQKIRHPDAAMLRGFQGERVGGVLLVLSFLFMQLHRDFAQNNHYTLPPSCAYHSQPAPPPRCRVAAAACLWRVKRGVRQRNAGHE
jgi:hypothetical protein